MARLAKTSQFAHLFKDEVTITPAAAVDRLGHKTPGTSYPVSCRFDTSYSETITVNGAAQQARALMFAPATLTLGNEDTINADGIDYQIAQVKRACNTLGVTDHLEVTCV